MQAEKNNLTRQDLVEIYEKYSPQLFKYAVRLLDDIYLAEDCVSETFSRFLKFIASSDGPMDHLKAYLYRISHNWIMDYYRHRVPKDENIDIKQIKGQTANPESAVSHKLEQQKVRESLLNLPEKQQQVIMLRFFEEWSHEETASALGKSVEATRALQYRALKNLHNTLILKEIKGKRDEE